MITNRRRIAVTQERDSKCRICGTLAGADICGACHKIVTNIDDFLENPEGVKIVKEKLRLLDLKKGAAQAIETIDEDELERYADELKEAKHRVVEAYMEDIHEWVLRDPDSLENFLLYVLDLEKATLSQIKERFSSYFNEDSDG